MIDGADGRPALPAIAVVALLFLCVGSCQLENTRGQSTHADGGVAPSPIASEPIALEPVKTSPSDVIGSRDDNMSPMTSMHDDFVEKPHVGSFAWTDAQWHARCRGVRTSYNRNGDLRE